MSESRVDWRMLTPTLVMICTFLISVIGFFMIRTLTQVDNNIDNQTRELHVLSQNFEQYRVSSEGRFTKVETQVNFLDARLDKMDSRRIRGL